MSLLTLIPALLDVKETLFTIFDYPVSYIEFFGTVLGLISVFLAARANIFTWPTGIANAILFLIIFYQIHLYSDMFLQFYFCGMGVYGWFSWKNKAQTHQSAIRTMSNIDRLRLAMFIGAVTLGIGTLISKIHLILPQVFDHPASFPYIDTFIAIMSILATILLARRIFETWVLWITVDITSVWLYATKGVQLIAIEFCIFLGLAMLGIFSWYKLWKQGDEVTAESI